MGCANSKDENAYANALDVGVGVKSPKSPDLDIPDLSPSSEGKLNIKIDFNDTQRTNETAPTDQSYRTMGSELSDQPSDEEVSTEGEIKLSPAEIEDRRTREAGTTSYSYKTPARTVTGTVQYAVCSQRGYYPNELQKPNQDAYSITLNFADINNDTSLFAVYDGHGPKGEVFARYAEANLPPLMSKHVKEQRVKAQGSKKSFKKSTPASPLAKLPMLNEKQFKSAVTKAHIECNQKMFDEHSEQDVCFSGTTAISVAIHKGRLIVPNVGDSRVVLGSRVPGQKGKIVAKALSRDQTPWRKDERERVVKAGGRILSIGQIEGLRPLGHDDYQSIFGDRNPGEKGFVDELSDPPRVWLKDKGVPGASFTRSLGDSVANGVGVYAEPEYIVKDITADDQVVVIASDGVFEFLPNQTVINICAQSSSATAACEEIVTAAYEGWIKHEERTDDITAIVLYLGDDLLQ